jgi:sulfate/thiosulfate transport system permease protein
VSAVAPAPARRAARDPLAVRVLLTATTLLVVALFLVLPLAVVFVEAFAKGAGAFWEAVRDPETLFSVRLTLLVTTIVVAANLVFGLAAAWAVTRFSFPGRRLLSSLIELPLSISPVVSGLVFILLLGDAGIVGKHLSAHGIKVIFALPGIIIATLFVTLPYVARELIPLMEAGGSQEEEAALTLGARGWQIFRRVTLPNISWGLLYGVVLASARALGEFGAVSVVSGHVRGETTTVPLQVEILYNEYHFAAAFAVASLLSLLALFTVAVKKLLQRRVAAGRAGQGLTGGVRA